MLEPNADPQAQTALAPEPSAAEPVRPADPPGYHVLDEVGRGGMGVVYRARDLRLDREVAVKFLLNRFAPRSSTAARFVNEARITAQLQHPGIPPVYHVGRTADDRPFLAMKLIQGDTLDALLAANAPLDRLAVFEAVAQAVAFAHAHGVIHRDLKPQNVMVGAFGEVQVMDWGLAKLLGPSDRPADGGDPNATASESAANDPADTPFTQFGSVVGTPAYMPPEQAAGELHKVDRRSDVFGLGAVLCVLLTGRPPFAGESADEVRLNAVRGKTADALARLADCGADPDAAALCAECLAVEPGDRPADAAAVAAAVAGLRAAADERARRAEVTAAEGRVRRRLRAAAGGTVTAVLLAGGLTAGLQWRRAERALETITDKERETAAALADKTAEEQRTRTALADAARNLTARDQAREQTAEVLLQLTEAAYEKYAARSRLEPAERRRLENVLALWRANPLGVHGDPPAGFRAYRALVRTGLQVTFLRALGGEPFEPDGRPLVRLLHATPARLLGYEDLQWTAGALSNIGRVQLDSDRPAGAVEWYTEAITCLDRFQINDYALRLVCRDAHAGRARAAARLDRHADAADDWNKAVDMSRPNVPVELWLESGIAFARSGRTDRSAAVAYLHLSDEPLTDWSLAQLMRLIGLYALLADALPELRDEFAKEVIRAVHEMIARDESAREAMTLLPAFDWLRDRADYRELVYPREPAPPPRPAAGR